MNENQNNPRRLTPEEKKALQFEQEQRRQAQEAGCFGLFGGSAFSARLKRDISADEASHEDGPFICRGCLSDAVLRKSEDEAFRKRFKEDNLPKERRKKQKAPPDWRNERW